ncbi:MAG TPA: GNAT family N-acetyltransferase [Nocardioidaceae bacterium]|nr:GNAT family N-acetyltransferase [Nocardioidaceae bacterium]
MNFPDDVPRLTDGTVTLRAHTAEDAQGAYEQCLDPVSQEWTTVPVPYSMEDARGFLTEAIPAGWRDDSEWAFAVEAADDTGTPRFAGTVSLRDEGDLRAEVAYGAHPWARGRGIMLRALTLLLDWGFEDKGLLTVIWWANKGNWSSRRIAWRLGFSFDGAVRQWLPQRGRLLDGWVGVLLSSEPGVPTCPWLEIPRIVGAKSVLRVHQPKDDGRVQEACSDERASYWLSNLPTPYTLQHAQEYAAARRESAARGTALHWAVADPRTDLLIANISLFDIKAGDDAEIGYWTHPSARGTGVMTEACGLVIRHAFIPVEDGGVGLRRLRIYAAQGNHASRHVIEANGFVETGRQRADTKLGDSIWVDTITYDLLESEYARRRGRTRP